MRAAWAKKPPTSALRISSGSVLDSMGRLKRSMYLPAATHMSNTHRAREEEMVPAELSADVGGAHACLVVNEVLAAPLGLVLLCQHKVVVHCHHGHTHAARAQTGACTVQQREVVAFCDAELAMLRVCGDAGVARRQ
jgi:hypothetical protein